MIKKQAVFSLLEKPYLWALFAFLISFIGLKFFIDPISWPDARGYHDSALHFLQTGVLKEVGSGDLAKRAPVTVFMTSFVYLFSQNPFYVALLQRLALLPLTIFFLVKTFQNIFPSDRVSRVIFGFLCVTYFPIYYVSSYVMPSSVSLFLVSLAMYTSTYVFLDTCKRSKSLTQQMLCVSLLGVLFGLLTLTIFYVFYFPIFLAAVLLLRLLAGRILGIRVKPIDVPKGVVFCLSFALCLAPWIYRNAVQLQMVDRISTNSGYILFQGNYALSQGDWKNPVQSKWWNAINQERDRIVGFGRNEVEKDDLLKSEAMRIIKTNKLLFVAKVANNVYRFFSLNGMYEMESRFLQLFTYLQYSCLVVCAIFGVLFSMRRIFFENGFLALWLSFLIFSALMYSVAHLEPRYKEPIFPILLCFATFAISYVVKRLLAFKTNMFIQGQKNEKYS